jgi:hypothetical protein
MTEENRSRLRELLGSVSQPSVIVGPGIPSSVLAREPMEALPAITDAGAALQALLAFFESRQMLTREDFTRIVRQSQAAPAKR